MSTTLTILRVAGFARIVRTQGIGGTVSKDDARQAIFGVSDGLCSCLGLVLALAITGHTQGALLGGIAVAAGELVSMGAGSWLSDDAASVRRAVVIGVASLCGGLIPVVPLAVGASPWWCLPAGALGGLLVAWLRPGSWRVSVLQTFGVLVPAAALAVGVTLLAN